MRDIIFILEISKAFRLNKYLFHILQIGWSSLLSSESRIGTEGFNKYVIFNNVYFMATTVIHVFLSMVLCLEISPKYLYLDSTFYLTST